MRRDPAFLLDMLLAARDAMRFVSGLSQRQFAESRLHQNAVIKAIEIVGEAAGRCQPVRLRRRSWESFRRYSLLREARSPQPLPR
jgi:uncharacterized protein with HEPN domain